MQYVLGAYEGHNSLAFSISIMCSFTSSGGIGGRSRTMVDEVQLDSTRLKYQKTHTASTNREAKEPSLRSTIESRGESLTPERK